MTGKAQGENDADDLLLFDRVLTQLSSSEIKL